MSAQFCQHVKKFIEIDDALFPEILSYFERKSFRKKDMLMEAGKTCRANYFVASGCVHMYCITNKGTESTVQFGIENWWITDSLAFHHQSTTDFNIRAVEDSEILSISSGRQAELLMRFPVLEKYFRIINQIAYGSALMRMKYIFNSSKEDIFFSFREHHPDFVQRVPQYLIASFLGLTPEYLSEIRKKKRS